MVTGWLRRNVTNSNALFGYWLRGIFGLGGGGEGCDFLPEQYTQCPSEGVFNDANALKLQEKQKCSQFSYLMKLL